MATFLYIAQTQIKEAKFPQSTDKSFYEKICAVHKKKKDVFVQPRFSTNKIIIKHYAQDVEYDTIGFLEKTKQSFGTQMLRMMQCSNQKEYRNLFIETEDQQNSNGRGRSSKRSVGIEFRNALSKLMADLKQTERLYTYSLFVCNVYCRVYIAHYVRCIKPNENKKFDEFNGISVLRQLKCSGVLATVRIRSGGFPNRRPFKEFIQRYLVLAPEVPRKGGARVVIGEMCKLLSIDKTEYRLGISKIFLKDKVFHRLEGDRNALFTKSATMIQRFCRGYSERMSFWIIRESCELLQFQLRQYLKAADPSEEVSKILKIFKESEDEQKIVESIKKLEALGLRHKNVDIIAHLGGVKAIFEVAKRFDGNDKIKRSCTSALSRFSNNEENATKVARSGGVKQMVSNVNLNIADGDDEKQQGHTESIQLIDRLASIDRNVNIVIKEGTVDALTNALRNDSNNDRQHIAAKALGTITKHRAAAQRIGRDEKAIGMMSYLLLLLLIPYQYIRDCAVQYQKEAGFQPNGYF